MQNVKAVKHYEDARSYYQKGKYADAERSYQKAIKIHPDYADAHNDIGNLYLKTGRLKESFNAYRKALKIAPNHPKLLSNIGNVLMTQGEFEKALGWLEKAIQYDPENAVAHCNLGSTLRGLGEHVRAASAYRCAIKLNPQQALFHQSLGGVLIELGAPNEAIDCFKQVLNINPEDPAAYIGIGKAYNKQGDLDQAVSAYEKAISLDPANAKCYSGLGKTFDDHGEAEKAVLALHKALEIDPELISDYPVLVRNKKFTKIDVDIRAMESLYLSKGKTDIQRSHLAYSLGKAYEDLDDYNRSIELVIDAARLKRKTFDYSLSATCAKFDSIKAVFSPDFFARHSDVGHFDPAPIFILGLPRSGTSLVEQILASHPAVFGAGELKDLASVYQSITNTPESSLFDTFPDDLIGLSPEIFEDLGRQYISKIRRYSNTSTFVSDKLPHNFQRIGFIRAILPKARIIHCTRDPMDNCLSLFKTDFHKGHHYSYDMTELGQYYNLYRDLMDYWETTLPGLIYDQNYESLVSNQEEQTVRLLEYCGLPWNDACMEFYKTRRKVNTASNAQVGRPVYPDSVNRWRRYEAYLKPLISSIKR